MLSISRKVLWQDVRSEGDAEGETGGLRSFMGVRGVFPQTYEERWQSLGAEVE